MWTTCGIEPPGYCPLSESYLYEFLSPETLSIVPDSEEFLQPSTTSQSTETTSESESTGDNDIAPNVGPANNAKSTFLQEMISFMVITATLSLVTIVMA